MIWPVCLTGTECVITLCIETNKNKKTDDIWMYDINVPFPFPFSQTQSISNSCLFPCQHGMVW